MYYKINDFIKDWRSESEATLKIFNNLNDEILNKKFHDNIRTAGRLAWHIIESIPEMMNRTGLRVYGPEENSEMPDNLKKICEEYTKASESLIEAVTKNWTDDNLSEKINMYGEMWNKGTILSVMIVHQIHHRAQIIVLMRLAGLKVPGIYGPAREEWAQMGMTAQE